MQFLSRMGMAFGIATAFVATLSAHTITIGYENAGSPGSLTFWYGSYHNEVSFTEGSLNLVGVNGNAYPSTTVAFNLLANSKPVGLIDGVTNFYTDESGTGLYGSDVDGVGPTVSWQGVTFTSLTAGSYTFTYIPVASPTAEWAPYTNAVLSNTVTLSGQVVAGDTPEPASFVLFGAGITALVGGRAWQQRNSSNKKRVAPLQTV